MKEKVLYRYQGPVLRFNKLVAQNWTGETYATSEKQASNNLAYRFKLAMGLKGSTCIKLAGKPTKERS